MQGDFAATRGRFIDCLGECRAVLSRNPKNWAEWQRNARAAVQRLYDLKESHHHAGCELGLGLPVEIEGELIIFINVTLQRAYLWNEVSTIEALPAPSSWLAKLRQFIEDLGGGKAKRSTPVLWPEDELLLSTCADAAPAAISQPDLSQLTGLPKRKVSDRIKYLESKGFVKRPDGTARKGHGITSAGLTAIGRLDGAP